MSGHPQNALEGKPVLVVGCGIVGLSTAILLRRFRADVTIWAKDLPPNTTSNKAAAIWYPFLSAPADKVGKWAIQTLEYYKYYMMKDPATGVMECPIVELFDHKKRPDEEPHWAKKLPSFRRARPEELSKGYVDGWYLDAVMVNTTLAMEYLMKMFKSMGGKVVQRELQSLHEGLVNFDVVVNCTGLGARTLVPDPRVYPLRGQILRIKHNGWKTSVFEEEGPNAMMYVIPRQNDIIIGGTGQAHNWSEKPDPKDTEGILKRVAAVLPKFEKVEILETKVGLRPARDEVRVEAEPTHNNLKLIVHNYGHGGSGWTLCWGTGMEAIELIFAHLEKKKPAAKL